MRGSVQLSYRMLQNRWFRIICKTIFYERECSGLISILPFSFQWSSTAFGFLFVYYDLLVILSPSKVEILRDLTKIIFQYAFLIVWQHLLPLAVLSIQYETFLSYFFPQQCLKIIYFVFYSNSVLIFLVLFVLCSHYALHLTSSHILRIVNYSSEFTRL